MMIQQEKSVTFTGFSFLAGSAALAPRFLPPNDYVSPPRGSSFKEVVVVWVVKSTRQGRRGPQEISEWVRLSSI
jgi:hypothetical protein